MNKSEFIKEAEKLGYTKEEIADKVKMREEAKKDGVIFEWELFLVEKPIVD